MLISNNFTPVGCGSTCGTLPTYTAPACEINEMNNISMIFFSRQPFTNDPVSAASAFATEWASRLSNSSSDANAIRFKTVDAQLPQADPDTVRTVSGTQLVKLINRTITFTDDDFSDANHAWHAGMQCNGVAHFWYEINGKLYGGKNGIKANFYSVEYSVDGDATSNGFNATISFQQKGIIPRAAKPV